MHSDGTPPVELGLQLPLQGVQLIEASAGTGKTHTLATLHARLVIERGLPVDQILAVTYTRAATAELRERLRATLSEALRRAELDPPVDPNNDALDVLLCQARQREGEAALRYRLRRAVAAMDTAPIHTIHAFCQQVLRDHALESGQSLAPRALLANDAELREEVATEFWRLHSRAAASLHVLHGIDPSPRALAKTLQQLLRVDALEPAAPASIDSDAILLQARASHDLAQTFRLHGEQARELIRAAAAAKVVTAARIADAKADAVWAAFATWLDSEGDDEVLHDNTFWFGSAELRAASNKDKQAQVPQSPLFDAIERWHEARQLAAAHQWQARLAMLHRLREFGRERLRELKRERDLVGYDDLIDGVATALQPPHGDAFAQRLQARYRVALVDEFQDTDPQQCAIFTRLFATPGNEDAGGAARALFLIGDPKQAIYRFRGGDVVAYLVAAHRADARHTLDYNFRSRPLALAAVQALFQHAGANPFAHPDIDFHPVMPAARSRDSDFSIAGVTQPALHLLTLDGIDSRSAIGQVREQAADACAAAIVQLLHEAASGAAVRRNRSGDEGPVGYGDIAVLVQTNDDALIVRERLDAAGVPCVVSGRETVLQTEQAEDLRCLLHSLRTPGDESRLRAALATRLMGLDAAAIAALDLDETAQRDWQQRMVDLRRQCDLQGPLAVVNELCAANAARLLQQVGGERRLANYLQLGELLQSLAAHALGVDALLGAFELRIAHADRDNADEMLRLESDADRVSVLTLHKSKGLEFEFVFLPLIGTHGGSTGKRGSRFAQYHDGERQVLHLLGADAQADRQHQQLQLQEEHAERLRLLYVGLTRARLATWVCWGDIKGLGKTPLAWLLHRQPGADAVGTTDAEAIDADLGRLQAAAPDAIALQRIDAGTTPVSHQAAATAPVPAARTVRRRLNREWWVYSYTMLAREQAHAPGASQQLDDRRADDEVESVIAMDTDASRLSGARFGNCLHSVLEHAQFARWRDWRETEPPAEESVLLDAALLAEGFSAEADLLAGRLLLTRLVSATLNTRLPEGLRLCELDAAARRDELEFHLSLAPVAIDELLALLHVHAIVAQRQGFGLRRRIEGLLTGRIDLVYRHEGRYYLLDYKSNRLGDYSPAALATAVSDSEYDLQYVLYTLALHRWLRFRLGPEYDYDRSFGGVRYLFARGIDPAAHPGHGIHATRPPRALIEALDRLFAGNPKVSA